MTLGMRKAKAAKATKTPQKSHKSQEGSTERRPKKGHMLIFDRGLFHEIMHAALAPCPRPPASHLPFEALFVSLIHAASFLFPLAMS